MAKAKRKSSAQRAISKSSEFTAATTRTYAASVIALIGVSSIISMSLLAPALAPQSLVNDSNATSKVSMLSPMQKNESQDPAKQLAVRTGGFSLFSHRLAPLLTIAGGAESSILKTKDVVLTLYFIAPTAVACIVLVSLLWILVFSEENESSTTQRAAVFNSNNSLSNQEIFLHDNALFSSKVTSSSSSPPTPSLEERPGASGAAVKESEDEEITLQTPPRLPESSQPTSSFAAMTPTATAAAAAEEGSPSPQSTRPDDESSPSALSLGPRASLKLPSSHSPSARAPTHKTHFFTGSDTTTTTSTTNKKSPLSGSISSPRAGKTIENDAFVLGNNSDVFKDIDNIGIWETAPIRVEPTSATVLAVAGEEDVTENLKEIAGEENSENKKTHYNLEDLKNELKATKEMIAALEIKKI